jgi:ethanolaminephosphotransferase
MTLCAAGPSFLSFSILVFALLGFGFATWERYYVGGLYLPVLNMPIEGLLLIVLVFVVTGIFGHSIWSYTLKDLLPLLSYFPSIISNIELRFLVIIITCITALVCIYFK